MGSQQRKQAIQALLKRGQLKKLATELGMSYSYLSQVFSPETSIRFTNELARKVEKELGLITGHLDNTTESTSSLKNPQGLAALALRGRAASIQAHYQEQRIKTHVAIKVGELSNHADLVIYNKDDSLFLIAEQSNDYTFPHKAEQLIMLMAITGAQYGAVFAPDSGLDPYTDKVDYVTEQKRSVWYQSKDGKIINTDTGPEGFYACAGI